MISMDVRQDDDFDGPWVQTQGSHVVQQYCAVCTSVKQNLLAAVLQPDSKAPAGSQARDAPACPKRSRWMVVKDDGEDHSLRYTPSQGDYAVGTPGAGRVCPGCAVGDGMQGSGSVAAMVRMHAELPVWVVPAGPWARRLLLGRVFGLMVGSKRLCDRA